MGILVGLIYATTSLAVFYILGYLIIEGRDMGYKVGWKFRMGSLWIGAHWSEYNKRLCINLLPTITFWIVFPGGIVPK